MEREGQKGEDGTAEDAGVDYGLAGATHRGMDMEGAWSGDGWGKGYQLNDKD